jgi:ATP-dependent Clp protease ATP-binding subunit ClpC
MDEVRAHHGDARPRPQLLLECLHLGFGTPQIESEQLLLGLLAADKSMLERYLGGRASATEIREAIVQASEVRPPTPTSMDLPLSNECKRILKFGAEESTSSGRQHIETEDLLLGILREKDSFAARLLVDRGLDLEQARSIAKRIKPAGS